MNKIFIWILRIVPAVIMLQTLYFKFTAHPQSVKLFTILGMEPWGRITVGVFELIAGILLMINRTALLGALLGAGLMCGAIFFHLSNSQVGIYFDGDPLLFIYAVITLLCCATLVLIYRRQIPALLKLKF
ncbi:DoxX family protein [Ferruginibacter sp.]